MIIPVAYAAFVWIVLYTYRGRWLAILLLLLSLIPPAALTLTASFAARQGNALPSHNFFVNNLAGMGMIFHIFTGSYAAVLFSVGLVIAVQKPVDRSSLQCLSCGYDLAGNETGECPECGVMLTYEQIERLARAPGTSKHPGAAPDFASDAEAEAAGRRHARPKHIPAHLTTTSRDA
ncbi:MAG: hypothetical protein KDA20_02565 [Phycisphaerales bacterium]|nr:hypothetical protein [Phycisphaerales bacterium]